MRALSLLAPALALVSVEADTPLTADDFAALCPAADGEFQIIEITVKSSAAWWAAVIYLRGDGWSDVDPQEDQSGGSYVDAEERLTLRVFAVESETNLELLNIGTYPESSADVTFEISNGPFSDRAALVIVEPAVLGNNDIDCNADQDGQDGLLCVPPTRGYETLIRAPVCFKHPPRGGWARPADVGCVDTDASLFLTGVDVKPTSTPTDGDPTPTPNSYARIRRTGCRSIVVDLQSDDDGSSPSEAALDGDDNDADEGVDGEGADEGVDDDNDAESRAPYGAPLARAVLVKDKDTRVKDLPLKDSDNKD